MDQFARACTWRPAAHRPRLENDGTGRLENDGTGRLALSRRAVTPCDLLLLPTTHPMRDALLSPAARSAVGGWACGPKSPGDRDRARSRREQPSPMLFCAGHAARRPGTPRVPRNGSVPSLLSKSLSVSSIIPPMTPEEHLTLSPWEKCTRFRRFPVKFVVQMALVATCSLQTLYYTDSVIPYFLDADRMLHAAFYGFDSQDGGRVDAVWSPPGNSGRWSAEIMHKEDFSRSIQQLGQTFLDFPKDAIDRYDIRGSQAVIKAQIEWRSDAEYLQTLEMTDERGHLDTDLQFQSADCRGLTWDDSVATSPGALCAAFDIDPLNATEGGIGPFGSFTEWHRFFPRLVRLQLQVALTDYDASFLTKLGKSHCTVEWIVTAMYTVRSSGLVQVGYDTSARLASRDNQHNMPSGSGDARTVFTDGAKRIYPEGVGTTTQYLTWYWLCTATMTLSSLSFVLCTRALLSNWLNSRALAKYPESLPYLRAQEKKRTSRSWLLLTLLQNIVNIASTLQLSSESFSQDFTETDWLLSSSIFLTLLNATRYLEWVRYFAVHIHS